MEKNPKVSIITVCYNSEKTIQKTIEAVLNQTYKNIEYLVIDGKSTDGTLGIVKSFEGKFGGRMKIVSEKDGGIYYALNKGIDSSAGELIGFSNSDDWYEVDAVEKAVAVFVTKPEAFIYGLLRLIKDEKVLMISTGSHEFLPGSQIPYPTWFLPKVLFKKFGNFELKYKIGSDVDLVLRFFKNGVQFHRLESILANFRVGGKSDQHVYLSRIEVLMSMQELGFISKNKLYYNILLLRLSIVKEKIYKFFRSILVKIISYD